MKKIYPYCLWCPLFAILFSSFSLRKNADWTYKMDFLTQWLLRHAGWDQKKEKKKKIKAYSSMTDNTNLPSFTILYISSMLYCLFLKPDLVFCLSIYHVYCLGCLFLLIVWQTLHSFFWIQLEHYWKLEHYWNISKIKVSS